MNALLRSLCKVLIPSFLLLLKVAEPVCPACWIEKD